MQVDVRDLGPENADDGETLKLVVEVKLTKQEVLKLDEDRGVLERNELIQGRLHLGVLPEHIRDVLEAQQRFFLVYNAAEGETSSVSTFDTLQEVEDYIDNAGIASDDVVGVFEGHMLDR